MTNFSIERAVNKEFYALFTGDNGEPVWRTTDTYKRKGKALKAIGIISRQILTAIPKIVVIDNTLKKPTEEAYPISTLLKK